MLRFRDAIMLEPIKLIVRATYIFWRLRLQWCRLKAKSGNDKQLLKDNILPYSLVKHTHELEVDITVTKKYFYSSCFRIFQRYFNNWELCIERSQSTEKLIDLFDDFYRNHELIDIQKDAPDLQQVGIPLKL